MKRGLDDIPFTGMYGGNETYDRREHLVCSWAGCS